MTFNPSRKLHDSSTANEKADRKAALKRKRDTSSSSSQTPLIEQTMEMTNSIQLEEFGWLPHGRRRSGDSSLKMTWP